MQFSFFIPVAIVQSLCVTRFDPALLTCTTYVSTCATHVSCAGSELSLSGQPRSVQESVIFMTNDKLERDFGVITLLFSAAPLSSVQMENSGVMLPKFRSGSSLVINIMLSRTLLGGFRIYPFL